MINVTFNPYSMNKLIISIVFIFLVNIVFAQKYEIRGRVISELDSAKVVGAVISCHPDSTVNVAFTDSMGHFKLSKISEKTKKNSISCLGYKKIYIPISFQESKMEIDLGLIRLPIVVQDMG